ncbi:hypothetical protein S245_045893 [Arachis hypogaea]|nr:uncharacterized protein DS421_13g431390 [Arachis hypogaea]
MTNRMREKERLDVEFKAFLIERIALVFIAIVTASIWWPCAAHTVVACPSTDDPHTWSFIFLVLFTYTIMPAFYVFRWFYTVVANTEMSPWIERILFILERLLVVVTPAGVPQESIFVNPTFLMYFLSLLVTGAYFICYLHRFLFFVECNSFCFDETDINSAKKEEEEDHDNGKYNKEKEEEEEEEVHTSDDEFKEEEEEEEDDAESTISEWLSKKKNKECSKCEAMLGEWHLVFEKMEKLATMIMEDAMTETKKRQQQLEEFYKKEKLKLDQEIQTLNQKEQELLDTIEEAAKDLYEKEKKEREQEKLLSAVKEAENFRQQMLVEHYRPHNSCAWNCYW